MPFDRGLEKLLGSKQIKKTKPTLLLWASIITLFAILLKQRLLKVQMEDKIIDIFLIEDDEVDIINVKRALKENQIFTPLDLASNALEALALLKGIAGSTPS
jgi:hypothetical protein